jgi:hypothetical protein
LPIHHLNNVSNVEARVKPTESARLTIDRDRDHAQRNAVTKDTRAVVCDQRNRSGAMGPRQNLRHDRKADDGEEAVILRESIPLDGRTAAIAATIIARRNADHIDVTRQSCLPSESAANALRTGRHP